MALSTLAQLMRRNAFSDFNTGESGARTSPMGPAQSGFTRGSLGSSGAVPYSSRNTFAGEQQERQTLGGPIADAYMQRTTPQYAAPSPVAPPGSRGSFAAPGAGGAMTGMIGGMLGGQQAPPVAAGVGGAGAGMIGGLLGQLQQRVGAGAASPYRQQPVPQPGLGGAVAGGVGAVAGMQPGAGGAFGGVISQAAGMIPGAGAPQRGGAMGSMLEQLMARFGGGSTARGVPQRGAVTGGVGSAVGNAYGQLAGRARPQAGGDPRNRQQIMQQLMERFGGRFSR